MQQAYELNKHTCRCDEMVDVADSKSAASDGVPVRVRSPAPIRKGRLIASLFLLAVAAGREPIEMQQSGGLLLDPGSTGSTPLFLPSGQKRKSSPVTARFPHILFSTFLPNISCAARSNHAIMSPRFTQRSEIRGR